MNAKLIAYWITTIFLALELLVGGITDLIHGKEVLIAGAPVVDIIVHLGYPVYLLIIIGIWKVLGSIAVVVPRCPRLKEWAYAGAFFEMTGAAASHIFRGDGPGVYAVPLVFAVLTLASWALRPPSRGSTW